jgi:hypothetical protein
MKGLKNIPGFRFGSVGSASRIKNYLKHNGRIVYKTINADGIIYFNLKIFSLPNRPKERYGLFGNIFLIGGIAGKY